jgi:hypothetical protein
MARHGGRMARNGGCMARHGGRMQREGPQQVGALPRRRPRRRLRSSLKLPRARSSVRAVLRPRVRPGIAGYWAAGGARAGRWSDPPCARRPAARAACLKPLPHPALSRCARTPLAAAAGGGRGGAAREGRPLKRARAGNPGQAAAGARPGAGAVSNTHTQFPLPPSSYLVPFAFTFKTIVANILFHIVLPWPDACRRVLGSAQTRLDLIPAGRGCERVGPASARRAPQHPSQMPLCRGSSRTRKQRHGAPPPRLAAT